MISLFPRDFVYSANICHFFMASLHCFPFVDSAFWPIESDCLFDNSQPSKREITSIKYQFALRIQIFTQRPFHFYCKVAQLWQSKREFLFSFLFVSFFSRILPSVALQWLSRSKILFDTRIFYSTWKAICIRRGMPFPIRNALTQRGDVNCLEIHYNKRLSFEWVASLSQSNVNGIIFTSELTRWIVRDHNSIINIRLCGNNWNCIALACFEWHSWEIFSQSKIYVS